MSVDEGERVKITEEILETMKAEISRTGVGAFALFSKIDNPPDRLNRSLIAAWLYGSLKTARKDLLDFVLEYWKTLPDCNLIDLTPELVAELSKEKERTGIGEVALLRGTRPSAHNGLCSAMVRQWLVGTAQRADKANVEFVMARWKALPDYDDEWVTLTEQQRQDLKALKKRAQISWERFFRECEDLPSGLSFDLFNVVIYGGCRSIRKHHYKYVLDALTVRANKVDSGAAISATPLRKGYIALTDEMREALKAERERTGVKAKSLSSIIRTSHQHTKVEAQMISRWIQGRQNTIPEALYNEVIAAWRSLPDKNAFWER